MSNNTTTTFGRGNPISDGDVELLSQYIDGELAPAEARLLESRLNAENALRLCLVRMQEMNQRLRDSLTARATIPSRLESLLLDIDDSASTEIDDQLSSAQVLAFPNRTAGPAETTTSGSSNWAYAMAASLVAALGLALVFNTQSNLTSLPGNDALVSAALDAQTSGDDWLRLEDGRDIQPVLSFAHEDGNWCREYLLRGGEADWRAVACREDGRWQTQAASLESYLESTDAYRPAGVNDSAPVAIFISQHAADIALDLNQESALINKNWVQ